MTDGNSTRASRRVVVTSQPLFQKRGVYSQRLEEAGYQVDFPRHHPLTTDDDVIAALQGADAVLAGSERYTPHVLAQLPQLRVIARTGVGYDAIDLQAANAHGIPVTITPDANHQGVAEHAFSLMLALARQVITQTAAIRQGQWRRSVPIIPMRGRTLGIVGMGRIGKSLAARAVAFGMRVIAVETLPRGPYESVELVDWPTLLTQSDFVSLHVPLTPETRHLIDGQALATMRPHAFLINTARGGLVDEVALCRALQQGQLAGAGLDVFEQEPPPPDHPLLQLENVIATAHLAGVDLQSLEESSLAAAQSVLDLSQGKWREDVVVNGVVRSLWQTRTARDSAT